jgi:sigma-B regulation protein RsbU (phosphoserine phosphatase)
MKTGELMQGQSEKQSRVEAFGRRHRTGLVTVLFTDMVGSTALKHQLGDHAAADLFDQHHAIIRDTLRQFAEGEEIETAGDSFFLIFATPSDAVEFALTAQARLRTLSNERGADATDRIGIHLGEVVLGSTSEGNKPRNLFGIQIDTCARVMSLAKGGQVLMTRSVFDSARQSIKGLKVEGRPQLEWVNHGPYLLKGLQEPVEICEVREASQQKAQAPANCEKAHRLAKPVEDAATAGRTVMGEAVANKRSTGTAAANLDLARMRHELRTPINHILGYCEMLLEEKQLPEEHTEDLRRIHAGGKELQALITHHFDSQQFYKERDLHDLYHHLRTPVNHIIGYAELLIEQAEDNGWKEPIPDLRKIRDAADSWLALMEAYLVEPVSAPEEGGELSAGLALNIGFTFKVPEPKSVNDAFRDEGAILVVDDDESSREMLARRLRRCGYTVSAAANGILALSLARRQKFDVMLLDMIMPGLDGFQVLAKLKADPVLRELSVIMLSALDEENGIARCIEMGAEDYLAKPFNPVFLRARLGACLEKKRLRDKERKTYEALVKSQRQLAAELAEASTYVRSMLPAPLTGRVETRWHFQPSAQLGGDAFGYHWLDEERLAIYLVDVCGHGVGAALLSVSALDAIRGQTLPNIDFGQPSEVVVALNKAFQMDRHNHLFFSIWYGVVNVRERFMQYTSGGHPPALLLGPATDMSEPIELRTDALPVGCFERVEFPTGTQSISNGARLLVFSDGVFEILRPDGRTGTLKDFLEEFRSPEIRNLSPAARFHRAMAATGSGILEDDFSLLELRFNLTA